MKMTRNAVAQICKDCVVAHSDDFYDVDQHVFDAKKEIMKLERTDYPGDDASDVNAGVMQYLIDNQEEPDYAVVFFSEMSAWACEYFK